MGNRLERRGWVLVMSCLLMFSGPTPSSVAAAPGVTREQVEQSIKGGVNFLLKTQRPNGTWGTEAGESALGTLPLLTAGESPDSEPMRRAIEALRGAGFNATHETYTRSLMTM